MQAKKVVKKAVKETVVKKVEAKKDVKAVKAPNTTEKAKEKSGRKGKATAIYLRDKDFEYLEAISEKFGGIGMSGAIRYIIEAYKRMEK